MSIGERGIIMSGFFGFLAFAAFVFFILGLIKPQKFIFWGKRKRGSTFLYLVAFVVFLIVSVSTSPGAGATPTSVSSATGESASSSQVSEQPASSKAASEKVPASAAPVSSKAPATKEFSVTLLPGYYEIGADLPSGTYDFDIVTGNGNVSDINDGVNLIMGKNSDDMYQKSYKNAELTDGSTLVLSQCSIKVSTKNAGAVKARDNSSAKAFNITSSGKYAAGRDFQPGYYDIELVSGQGNVICMENQLNAIFSKDASLGVTEYKNVKFESGNTLQIEGPKLKLTPSK